MAFITVILGFLYRLKITIPLLILFNTIYSLILFLEINIINIITNFIYFNLTMCYNKVNILLANIYLFFLPPRVIIISYFKLFSP